MKARRSASSARPRSRTSRSRSPRRTAGRSAFVRLHSPDPRSIPAWWLVIRLAWLCIIRECWNARSCRRQRARYSRGQSGPVGGSSAVGSSPTAKTCDGLPPACLTCALHVLQLRRVHVLLETHDFAVAYLPHVADLRVEFLTCLLVDR